MGKHSDDSVRMGDHFMGRFVTTSSIHAGAVTKIVQTPGEYTRASAST